jgi:hypothetical protein
LTNGYSSVAGASSEVSSSFVKQVVACANHSFYKRAVFITSQPVPIGIEVQVFDQRLFIGIFWCLAPEAFPVHSESDWLFRHIPLKTNPYNEAIHRH